MGVSKERWIEDMEYQKDCIFEDGDECLKCKHHSRGVYEDGHFKGEVWRDCDADYDDCPAIDYEWTR